MEDSNLKAEDRNSEKSHQIQDCPIDEYIRLIFDAFLEMHGDRKSGDDKTIIGGLARLNNYKIVVIGHQNKETSDESNKTSPAGYRKALRLINLAEDFNKPVIVFADASIVPFPKMLEQQMSESIARYLERMSSIIAPSIGVVMGGIFGVSAFQIIAVDRVIFQEIDEKGRAEDMPLYREIQDLLNLDVIHNIVNIASDDSIEVVSSKLRKAILEELDQLAKINPEVLVEQRLVRLQNQLEF